MRVQTVPRIAGERHTPAVSGRMRGCDPPTPLKKSVRCQRKELLALESS
jgi:hypothetical protein